MKLYKTQLPDEVRANRGVGSSVGARALQGIGRLGDSEHAMARYNQLGPMRGLQDDS